MISFKSLFHIVGAIQFGIGCFYDYNYVVVPSGTISGAGGFGGKFKYLTFLNAIVQALYFTVASLNDMFGSNENTPSENPPLRRHRDTMFCSLAFPLSIFVATTFWGIYAIDRELILPRALDPYFPNWLNHVMHTNIAIFILIELVTTFRMYPSRKNGLSILALFMLCYMIWIHVIYFNTNHWVYPILAVLNWPLRIVFYLFSLAFVSSLYLVGESMNRCFWSGEVEETLKSGKKKAK